MQMRHMKLTTKNNDCHEAASFMRNMQNNKLMQEQINDDSHLMASWNNLEKLALER